MQIYLLTTTKRLNSTFAQTVSGNATADAQLKAPCTVLKPVLEFVYSNISTSYGTLTTFNYAYIPDFNRYYYITNWTLANAKAIASLEVDVLASYKTAINNSLQYVLRSDSSFDGNIIDTKYPIKTDQPTRVNATVNNPLQPASTDYGCFVLGIINNDISLSGCVTYYVMSYLVFVTFCTNLFTLSTFWGSDSTISDGTKKALSDPFQYIVSCLWLPYSTQDFVNRGLVETQTGSLKVGYTNVSFTGTAYVFDAGILNVEFTNMITITPSKHPLASLRGDYLNVAPYSRYFLSFYPFCGEIELDSVLIKDQTLYVIYTVDLRTGKGIMSLCTDHTGTTWADWKPKSPFRVIEAQVGVSLPLASIHTVLPTSLGQVTASAASAATGVADIVKESGGFMGTLKRFASTVAGWQGKALGLSGDQIQQVQESIGAEPFTQGDASSIAGNAAAATSTAELIGSQGTISLNSRMPFQMYSLHYGVTNMDNITFGRPLCQRVQLSTLSGFCLCADPHIDTPAGAHPSEVTEIENYLTSGIFLE